MGLSIRHGVRAVLSSDLMVIGSVVFAERGQAYRSGKVNDSLTMTIIVSKPLTYCNEGIKVNSGSDLLGY